MALASSPVAALSTAANPDGRLVVVEGQPGP